MRKTAKTRMVVHTHTHTGNILFKIKRINI